MHDWNVAEKAADIAKEIVGFKNVELLIFCYRRKW